ncbi:mechanosensitive ion channel family protein [Pseudidiomarina insulisalsae]|uniref:Small-conductance mechanosensitive channel n=1 Tax=Pseudidiomarina insulisalsae TaxID=575789 RepID=A0A432YPS2_9GAMM|nr:mechanosensitive ion channel family protein [Pseudidiomarina insulisalsae]RUO63116.1 mechanosensitive ion channel protein MscS [Pseudidiomarina insulisalsae]
MTRWLSILLVVAALLGALPVANAVQDTATAEPAVKVIDAPQDAAIQTRLNEIKAAIGGLEGITISVTAGVVTLSGEFENGNAANSLIAIAERTEGVVYVENQLTESVQVSARLQPLTDKFQELGATALQLMPLLLIAVAVVVVFWLLGGWLSRRSGWLQRFGLSELGALLGKRAIRLLVTLIGLIIALEILNATTLFSAVLGVAGVFGIALGFAFRNIVENYLAGILLSARNPFRIGDLIQIGEFTGNVVRLTSRDTVLMTLDGNHLRIPNSVIITSSMTNFSLNPLRRFEFLVDITPDADLADARQIARNVLQQMKGILDEPAPQCLIQELGASTIVLKVLGWVDQRETDVFKARSEAIRFVKQAFDEAAIEMPEPTYRLRMGAPLAEQLTSAQEPTEAPKQAVEPHETLEDIEQTDVSADRTIDKQVTEELESSDEQNLLKR